MTCMLGGCFFSTSLMKGPLNTISNFIPQKWEMDAFEKLFSGRALTDIKINLLILLLFGAVFFTFGVKTLKPSAGDL
jgi:ABC-2 type transport system permease protein